VAQISPFCAHMDPQIDQPVACSCPRLTARAPTANSAQIAAAAIAGDDFEVFDGFAGALV
jgi:hypothetical protein